MRGYMADEAALVARLATGDRAAFEALYRRHSPSMLRICQGLVRKRATAEEIVQDTWLAVLNGIGRFEGQSSLAGWIFAILVNKARSQAQRDGRTVSFDSEGEEGGLAAAFDGRGKWKDMPALWETITPDRIVEGRSVMAHVMLAIEALPPAQRSVLILRGNRTSTRPRSVRSSAYPRGTCAYFCTARAFRCASRLMRHWHQGGRDVAVSFSVATV